MELDIKKLLLFIFDADITSACSHQDVLYTYIDAELDGIDVTTHFSDIKAHLHNCSSCEELYQEMKPLLLMERNDELIEPPIKAEFDFSYLPIVAQPTKDIWRVVERAGKQISELFCEVQIVLSKGKAFFEQLPSFLVLEPQMAPMPSRRRADKQREPILSLPSPEHDLSLYLTAIPPESEEQDANLIVGVTQLSSSKPVERCRVTLRDSEYRTLESNLTHSEGHVMFVDVSPASYVVEAKFQGRVLQMPIDLAWKSESQFLSQKYFANG